MAIFTVGLADPEIEENLNHIREGLTIHYLKMSVKALNSFLSRGGMDFEGLDSCINP